MTNATTTLAKQGNQPVTAATSDLTALKSRQQAAWCVGIVQLGLDRWPELTLGVHLHNTNGMALANAVAAMDAGVSVFEGSICGIGGGIRMPHGIAHFGNVSTEDLAHMFLEMGVETGVDLQGLIDAGHRARDLLGLETTFSYASQGGTKEAVLERGRVAPRH